MKNAFNIIVITLSIVLGFVIWQFWFGAPSHFEPNFYGKKPLNGNILGMIYTGGPIVAILIALLIISITYVFERTWSINRANGKGSVPMFIKNVNDNLIKGNLDGALGECEKQRGSLANILRSAIQRFKDVEKDPEFNSTEKVMTEVQRSIDEAINLETPLLEKNLVVLSTVSSIATMFGLLGTTIGMIRAFAAMGDAGGSVDATQLAVGISEALYNTAGGLGGAIISIVAFNFFTTKVDNYIYMIDEAILSVTQIFTIRVKK